MHAFVVFSNLFNFHDLTPNKFFLLPFSPEMVNLTTRLCWELVKKEGYIAIWQKPLNNSCYLSREAGTLPPLCDKDDDPDNVWYVLLVLWNLNLIVQIIFGSLLCKYKSCCGINIDSRDAKPYIKVLS